MNLGAYLLKLEPIHVGLVRMQFEDATAGPVAPSGIVESPTVSLRPLSA